MPAKADADGMDFHVISLFPEMFERVFDSSIPRIAQEKGAVRIRHYNLRDWSTDPKHAKVDDSPYGGGPGMVIKCDCTFAAVEAVAAGCGPTLRRILLSPTGRPLTQALARELAEESEILLLCGRYEGFDHRVVEGLGMEELSVGDYVLSGGEIPAMAVMDAVIRLLPGVLGDDESSRLESFEDGLLDFPVYTRPEEFRGMKVPPVLLSGHAANIDAWRREQALARTRANRADLLDK